MAQAGWYPDPGGQPGMYRYWDGYAWSAQLSPSPYTAPSNRGIGQPNEEQPPDSGPYGANQPEHGPQPFTRPQGQANRKKRAIGWWIGGGVLAVVIIVVGVIAIRSLTGDSVKNSADPGGSDSTENSCPTQTRSATAPPKQHPGDTVEGGPVSYRRLSSPWGPPQTDDRVPFGSDVKEQSITIERNYKPGQNWVASVLIGKLQAGDGFFSPKKGSKVVAECIASGEFYGNNKVKRSDQKSKGMKVDGHKAWYLRSHLSFDIEGLKATGETMIIVIIQAGKTSNGLYYASIPDNAKQYLSPAKDLISKLKISS